MFEECGQRPDGAVYEFSQGLGRGLDEAALQNRPGLQRLLAQRGGGRAGAGGGLGAGLGGGLGAGLGAGQRQVDSSSTPEEIAEHRDRLVSGAARLSKALAKILTELERVDQLNADAHSDDDIAESGEATTVEALESKPARTKKKPTAKKKSPAKRGTSRKKAVT